MSEEAKHADGKIFPGWVLDAMNEYNIRKARANLDAYVEGLEFIASMRKLENDAGTSAQQLDEISQKITRLAEEQ